MNITNIIKFCLPLFLIVKLHYLKRRFHQSRFYQKLFINRYIKNLRKKEKINVIFITFSPALWKIDSLYKSFQMHKRFNVEILISSNLFKNSLLIQKKMILQTKRFFDKKGYHYVEWDNVKKEKNRFLNSYDILFYQQHYEGIFPRDIDFIHNMRKVQICCPYAFHSGNQNWAYNTFHQNTAWIDCYENEYTKQLSCQQKRNKGINSIVTGLPFCDEFSKKSYLNPWKPQKQLCKKIIWAPHWTILQKNSVLPCYSNFLTMAEYMLEFAQQQINNIQFAFKPHPWLKRELYEHPDWGKEKTDSYYAAWASGSNTQLEEGDYVDLFMTSDAMIHDCSSFCCEYMFTHKPVFFMTRNYKSQISELNQMAYDAFHAQYLGSTLKELQNFVQKQVIEHDDPMYNQRTEIIKKYFTTPHGKSAAENIISAILGENY